MYRVVKVIVEVGDIMKNWLFAVVMGICGGAFANTTKLEKGHVLEGKNISLNGTGFHQVTGGNIAINSNKPTTAQVTTFVPIGNSRFDIHLYTVSETAGQSSFTLRLGEQEFQTFTTPIAKLNDDAEVVHRIIWQAIEINEGENFTLIAKNGSINGSEYSHAIWSKIVFVPLDFDPGKAKSDTQSLRSPKEIESGNALIYPRLPDGNAQVSINGEMKQWHAVTLNLDGPFAYEQDISPNPFLDYRMMVTFAHESGVPTYTVPGYFAADGNAAETSANSGNLWRAHVSPDKEGKWNYRISFIEGENAAIVPSVGKTLDKYNNIQGSFNVAQTDKTGRDFRAKGRLGYVGGHYLRHAGSGEYFIKAGTDAPETILAYADFDNTIGLKANAPIKTWQPHALDAKETDPVWQQNKGKNLLGALNYLASKGVNAFSFLTYNAAGDGDNIWPYVERNGKFHFDISKLDQWNIVFSHAQSLGLFLHFKLQENENDDNREKAAKRHVIIPESLDGGKLGVERKLYLRELIARFGHHLALNWNLGEENTQSYEEQRDMAAYVANIDAYDHHIVIHSFPSHQERVYQSLIGSQSVITGTSLQNSWNKVHQQTLRWVEASIIAGKPWVVVNDEQNPASMGVPPDPGYKGFDGWATDNKQKYNLHDIRKQTLWGNLMAGGAGVEYYFGYRLKENDLNAQDFRSRDQSWMYAAIAINFFKDHDIPVQRMQSMDQLITAASNKSEPFVFANKHELYLVYLPDGGTASLDLIAEDKPFTLRWFDPRSGGELQKGSVDIVHPGQVVDLGLPPADQNEDWLVVMQLAR
jgi:hypothetical protein